DCCSAVGRSLRALPCTPRTLGSPAGCAASSDACADDSHAPTPLFGTTADCPADPGSSDGAGESPVDDSGPIPTPISRCLASPSNPDVAERLSACVGVGACTGAPSAAGVTPSPPALF